MRRVFLIVAVSTLMLAAAVLAPAGSMPWPRRNPS